MVDRNDLSPSCWPLVAGFRLAKQFGGECFPPLNLGLSSLFKLEGGDSSWPDLFLSLFPDLKWLNLVFAFFESKRL